MAAHLAGRGLSAFALVAAVAGCGGGSGASFGAACTQEGAVVQDASGDGQIQCVPVDGGLRWGSLMSQTQITDGPATPGPGDAEEAQAADEPQPLLASLPIDVRALDFRRILKHYSTYSGYPTRTFPLLPFGLDEQKGGQEDPQPGFYAPLGTPVLAPVTSVVVAVEKLEHGDWTVMYAPSKKGYDIWETEHVIEVSVKVSDHVTAGQPVGLVSDVDCTLSRSLGNTAYCRTGLGMTELGLLKGGSQVPTHFCPFQDAYIDPVARDTIYADYRYGLDQSERVRGKKYMRRSEWETPYCMVVTDVIG